MTSSAWSSAPNISFPSGSDIGGLEETRLKVRQDEIKLGRRPLLIKLRLAVERLQIAATRCQRAGYKETEVGLSNRYGT